MALKSSTLCVATRTPGVCGDCRHANQRTVDFAEGHVFCEWGGGVRAPGTSCTIVFPLRREPGGAFDPYHLWERFDGANCTWGRRQDTRIIAEDADLAMRDSLRADEPFIPGVP